MDQSPTRLMIVAGEESGDMRAGALIKAIKAQDPKVIVTGIGGSRCKAEGVELISDITQLAVIGFAEVIRHFPRIKKVFNLAVQHAVETKPDAVILVDYPGFNLRLARKLKQLNFKIIYYVSPQVWAWKSSRVKLISDVVDRMIVLFPFEKEFYEKRGFHKVDFVGHPLIDEAHATKSRPDILKTLGLNGKKPIVALLPGSREKEITRHLPVMLAAAKKILQNKPDTQFVLLKAKNLGQDLYEPYMTQASKSIIATEDYYDGLSVADLCVVASGTATLETALMGKPMIVVYKTSWLTYLLARLVVKIPYISLANIVAGKKVAEELIQHQASPTKIAKHINDLLGNPSQLSTQARELKVIRIKLGSTGASMRAAKSVLSEIK